MPNGPKPIRKAPSNLPSRPGPLALVGGDELNPGNEPQDEVLVAAASGGPAYVLATAAGRQRPDLAVRNARAWFKKLGLDVVELPAIRRSDLTSPKNVELARLGCFFYLVGGDPGLVPKTLADTPVWDAIVQAWRDGAALAGSSAGAMALGEWTLIRDRRPGDARRRYRPALSLVPRVAVIPHFDRFGERWVDGALASAPRGDVVLVAVDERSAALWRDGVWRAFGPGGVTIITRSGRRRVPAGKRIEGIPQPAALAAPTSVADYLAALPQEPRAALEKLRKTIRAAAPEATETISYQMPTFKDHGRFLVSYAAFKDHCSLFPASNAVMEALGEELKPYFSGKGTLRFTADKPIPAALVKKIVKARIEENAARGRR